MEIIKKSKAILKSVGSFCVMAYIFIGLPIPVLCNIVDEITTGSGDLKEVARDMGQNIGDTADIVVPIVGFVTGLIAACIFMIGSQEGKSRLWKWIGGFAFAASIVVICGGIWNMARNKRA